MQVGKCNGKAKVLCEIKVTRSTQGLSIYARSEQIEQFFKGLEVETSEGSGDHSHLKFYYTTVSTSGQYTINRWGYGLYYNDKLNLSFIKTVGLAEGIIYPIKGVYSLEHIQDWVSKAKQCIREFYLQYIKPINIKITITENNHETC